MFRRPKTSADPRSTGTVFSVVSQWIRDQLSYGKRISPAGHSNAISNTTDPRPVGIRRHTRIEASQGPCVSTSTGQGSVVNTQYLKWYRHSS